MSIVRLEESRELKKEFERLGRDGIAQRLNQLVSEFTEKYPNGHYKEVTELCGRMHAIYISINNHDYWKEIANRGYEKERYDLVKFEKIEVEE